jgi:two-component system chemotaxis response regulator CheY
MNSKVLVIDDSGLVRKHMRRILNGAGYNVVEAHDGIAALETYFSEKPDVVLLDLVMSGMYGLDMFKKREGGQGDRSDRKGDPGHR